MKFVGENLTTVPWPDAKNLFVGHCGIANNMRFVVRRGCNQRIANGFAFHPKSRLFCLTFLFLLYAFLFALFLSYPRANEVRPMAKCIFLIYILLNYILFETRSVRFSYRFTKSTGPFICFLSFKIRVHISYYLLTFS